MIRQGFPPANTTGSSICQSFPRQKLKIAKFFPTRILHYRGISLASGRVVILD